MHRTAPTFTTLLMVQTNMFAQHRATVPLTSATTATIVPHASDSSTAHKDHAKGRCRSPVCLPRATQHGAGRGARPRSCGLAVATSASARHTKHNTRCARRPPHRRHRAAHASVLQDRRQRAKPRAQGRRWAHARPVTPLKICIQGVHGPPLADFAKGANPYPAFLLWGCPQGDPRGPVGSGPRDRCYGLPNPCHL